MNQQGDKRRRRDSVKVHIEELVLQGFAPSARSGIAAAMEQELARLIGEGGLPGVRGNPVAFDQINGGTFNVTAGAKPHATGAGIARAVFRGLQHARFLARTPRVR